MITGSVFVNNSSQIVRIPVDSRFPENVKEVLVRALGKERILTPIESAWDSFFLATDTVSDFMTHRATQEQAERVSFDD